jgi:hypothetical protein
MTIVMRIHLPVLLVAEGCAGEGCDLFWYCFCVQLVTRDMQLWRMLIHELL